MPLPLSAGRKFEAGCFWPISVTLLRPIRGKKSEREAVVSFREPQREALDDSSKNALIKGVNKLLKRNCRLAL
jgi:hypothetical protein